MKVARPAASPVNVHKSGQIDLRWVEALWGHQGNHPSNPVAARGIGAHPALAGAVRGHDAS